MLTRWRHTNIIDLSVIQVTEVTYEKAQSVFNVNWDWISHIIHRLFSFVSSRK